MFPDARCRYLTWHLDQVILIMEQENIVCHGAICVKVFLCAKQLVNLAVEHVLPKNINRLYAVDIRCLALSYWMRRGVSSFVH